jgi:hypothetical protein
MAYKCGNTGKEFSTRKEWLDHLCDVMNSPIMEGEERDVAYCKQKVTEKANKGDVVAQKQLKHMNMEL